MNSEFKQRTGDLLVIKPTYKEKSISVFIFQVTAPPEVSVTAEVRLSASGRGGIWVLVFMTPELCRSIC